MINVKALPIVDAFTSNGQPLVAILGPNHEVYWEAVKKMEGILPLIFESRKGGPLKEYKIYGNTPYQEWTPSPEKERTKNLLDVDELLAAPPGYLPGYAQEFAHVLAIELKPNVYYTLSSNVDGDAETAGSRCLYFNNAAVYNNHSVTVQSDGMLYIGFISDRTYSDDIINKNSWIMLNEGAKPLPYEPYGYREKSGPCEVKGVGEKTGNLLSLSMFGGNTTIDGDTIYFTATGIFQARTARIKRIYNDNTISMNKSSKGVRLEIRYLLNGIENPNFIDICSVGRPVTLRKNIEYDTIDIKLSNATEGAGTFYFSEIMLNEGSTALPYEPYGYKIPVVSRGRNILNGSLYMNGFYNLLGAFVDNGNYVAFKQMKVKPLTKYSISSPPSTLGRLCFYDINKNNITTTVPTNSNYTFTTDKNTQYIAFDMKANYGKVYKNDIIFNEGELIPYEPYIENTTTIYHDEPYFTNDYIRKDKDGGVEHREWGKYVFTGNETFDKIGGAFRIYIANALSVSVDVVTPAKCTHFIADKYETVINIQQVNYTFAQRTSSAGITNGFAFVYNDVKAVSDFIAWLKSEYDAGHPVTIYYPLATPTDTEKDLLDIVTASGYNSIDTDTQIKPEKMEIAYR